MRKIKKITAIILACTLGLCLFAGCKKEDNPQGNLKTVSSLKPGDTYAEIKLKDYDGELTFILFDEIAPEAVKQFTLAANNRYYDGKSIHRVLKDTLIQGGALNLDGSDNTIPTEEMFDIETSDNARNFFGALCFANDPESNMNYRQFYVVTANKPVDIAQQENTFKKVVEEGGEDDFTDEEMNEYRRFYDTLANMSDAVRERYAERGGLPLLDGQVTVFGQLITGWELLGVISDVEVVAGNRIDDNNTSLGGGEGQNSRPAEHIIIETIRIITIAEETEEP